MNTSIRLLAIMAAPALSQAAPVVNVVSHEAGPTPFIENVHLGTSRVDGIRTITFRVDPKPGSVTRPVSATYTNLYLKKRGYVDARAGEITVPVFGLYASRSNHVVLTLKFGDGSSQEQALDVSTPDWVDSCDTYEKPTVLQPRTGATGLSYNFMLIKNRCGTASPIIMDTDGEVRWAGTTGGNSLSSTFFDNAIYLAVGSKLHRIELDGAFDVLDDYSDIGVVIADHHNIDPGKRGMILEVDTADQLEAVSIQVDAAGKVLKKWDLSKIISETMKEGGDDPTQFVQPAPVDWFHMNAATYRESDNTVLFSSRENFVIAIDYRTNAVKWILGDTSKKWFQFASLRKFAVTLGPNTLPPLGQHAISITSNDELLLFDNGRASDYQMPAGVNRTYSTARRYRIDSHAMTATEVWSYPGAQSFSYSPYCSSVYEDEPGSYLIDYAVAGPFAFAEIIGLDPAGTKVFDYTYYPAGRCDTSWNAIPIHLESLMFKEWKRSVRAK